MKFTICFLLAVSLLGLSQACLEKCHTGQYCELFVICRDCKSNCATCKDKDTCDTCVDGYYLSNADCVACPSQCATCSSATSCQTCSPGYQLTGSTCTACPSGCSTCHGTSCSSCLTGYYQQGSSCQACMSHCAKCTSTSTCEACMNGYSGPNCQCSGGQVWNATSRSCSVSRNFAVIIAGSSGYENYRHQADTCHAYQTLLNKGIPAENIINLAYDDIAHNSENPIQGSLYNKPCQAASECWNVYTGCKFDYTGGDVTPQNFLNIITGNSAAMRGIGTGRVLSSTSADNVFLYFADHGGPGILGFPSSYLYANDLQAALNTMHSNNLFNQLVFYVEACESGSMFENFASNLNIYVVTAADASQSSYGTYCPPDDYVNGTDINSCLGDLFSVNWMQDTDAENTQKETLEAQYQLVKQQTNMSNVSQWGQKNFTSEVIGLFMGMNTQTQARNKLDFLSKLTLRRHQPKIEETRKTRLNYLQRRWLKDPENLQKKIEYETEIVKNDKSTRFFQNIANDSGFTQQLESDSYPEIQNWQCYKNLMKIYQEKCMPFTEFSIKYASLFINFCEDSRNIDWEYYLGEKVQQYC